jgi:hypothetical protein
MASEADDLLSAEQAVQNLLKELQALKKQVGDYDSARQSLDTARQSLDGLVQQTAALAEKTHSAITTLSKIGTPEILARVDAVRLAINEFGVGSTKQVAGVRKLAVTGLLISILTLVVSAAVLAKLFVFAAH